METSEWVLNHENRTHSGNGPISIKPIGNEKNHRSIGALGKRTRPTQKWSSRIDNWVPKVINKPFSWWYKGSDVLPKYTGTGNYDANSEKKMSFEAQNVALYPQIQMIRTQFTRCENKKFSSSLPKQKWNHELRKQHNNSDVFYLISQKVIFPGSQPPTLLLSQGT